MSVTYVTNINSLSCYPMYETKPDCVFQIVWTMSGTDGTYNASYSASTMVPYVQGQSYIPYADLTQDIVVGWVNQYTDPAVLENAQSVISQNIADQANPPVVTPPLPWNVPSTAPEPTPEEVQNP